ncbi:MAG: UDP-N-acetylmuramoyl-L-alanyl-D-glutamate--2,6-diaminopimelate ligase [Nitriliruptoraceae bacterium]
MTALLSDVVAALRRASRHGHDLELHDATHDSRQVTPGTLFCAIPGTRTDGHDHAADAVERGAAALLVERWLELEVPQVRVPSVRAATGPAAAVVHRHPSAELTVLGVTGTNGKTTVTYLLEAAIAAAGLGSGVVGTIETRIHGTPEPGVRTTPEGTDLQRLLRTMHTRGVDGVAMEVSSHGLDLRRVDGTRFAVAAYTNLSQDHLDWHGSMEAYLAAKARLFTASLSERGVVFLDGPWAARLLDQVEIPVTTVGRGAEADLRLVDERLGLDGGSARLIGRHPRGEDGGDDEVELTFSTSLLGSFNLANAATALATALAAGLPADAAVAGIAACPGAPGRLELVHATDPVVLVDYAHTPDALSHVIATVRDLLPDGARLTLVVGCGGDRDRAKRAPMGAAAARADRLVLTSDNPRSEDPASILEVLSSGAERAIADGAPAQLSVELDRRRAIEVALAEAGPDDVVVIAGKGHETTQELADRTVPFDDRVVARELLAVDHGDRSRS